MNMIFCEKDCIHQKEGYCNLKQQSYLGQKKVDGCCYYQSSQSRQNDHFSHDRKERPSGH